MCQLIIPAIQNNQLRIPAHIQICQLIVCAIQFLQCREMLYTRKIRNLLLRNRDFFHSLDLLRRQDAICGCIQFCHIGTEVFVGEIGFIDYHIPFRSHGGQTDFKCSGRKMQQCHAAHCQ